MKKVTHYFAYGSNMDPARAAARMPGALDIGRAALPGWRVVERLYADAVPDSGAVAEGVLYRVGGEELAALDRYEGYPGVYDRRVVLAVWRGRPVRAWIYVMTDVSVRNRTGLRYPEWYRVLCRDGAKAHGLRHNAFLRPRAAAAGDRPRGAATASHARDCGLVRGLPAGRATAWPTPFSSGHVFGLFVDPDFPHDPFVDRILARGCPVGAAVLVDGKGRPNGHVVNLPAWAFEALDTVVRARTGRVRTAAVVQTGVSSRLRAWHYAAR